MPYYIRIAVTLLMAVAALALALQSVTAISPLAWLLAVGLIFVLPTGGSDGEG